ncbi:MAG TPA: hypothetical protein VMV22_08675 [Acidimicrobiales bacterium]|nr:hypothetical protein [Acidimicrobiales bacterium]
MKSTLGKVLAASARRMDLPVGAAGDDAHREPDDGHPEDPAAQDTSATILLLL